MWSPCLTWSLGSGEPFPKFWELYASVFWVQHMLPLFLCLCFVYLVWKRPGLTYWSEELLAWYMECQTLGVCLSEASQISLLLGHREFRATPLSRQKCTVSQTKGSENAGNPSQTGPEAGKALTVGVRAVSVFLSWGSSNIYRAG